VHTADDKALNGLRRKMGVLFQMAALFDSMSVFENVAFGPRRFSRLSEKEIAELVTEKLAMVGLKGVEHLNPSALSGGMQKRVGLARAIALNPEIVLYDEPTTGVDPILGAAVDDLIKTLNAKNRRDLDCHFTRHGFGFSHRTQSRNAVRRGLSPSSARPMISKKSDDPVIRQFVEGSADGPIPIL
jgi:phospholipid/cholesterol/gamma-HCH transport system ATP-binding protein